MSESAAKTGWACGLYLCPHQPKCEFREPTDEQPAAQTSGDSMIDAYRQEIATQTAEVERLRAWLSRIRDNAQSWHGADPDGIDHAHHGQQKALNVIAGWCEEALNGE